LTIHSPQARVLGQGEAINYEVDSPEPLKGIFILVVYLFSETMDA